MHYEPQEVLTAPARPTSELWRFALGLVLFVACYIVLAHSFFSALSHLSAEGQWPQLVSEIDRGSTARGMLYILASFAFIVISLGLVVNLLHHRGFASLLGFGHGFRQQAGRVTVALLGLGLLLWMLPEPAALMPLERNMDMQRWLLLLPLSLPLLMMQTTAEELLWRGYIQSQLAARFAYPFIWIFPPALLFGALHYDPSTAGANAWAIALLAACFGLICADLTARAGTLAPAIVLHLILNASGLLYIAPSDTLYGLALYTHTFTLSDPALVTVWLPYEMMTLLCAWLAARLALER